MLGQTFSDEPCPTAVLHADNDARSSRSGVAAEDAAVVGVGVGVVVRHRLWPYSAYYSGSYPYYSGYWSYPYYSYSYYPSWGFGGCCY